jgi:hypothetical protein
MPQPQLSSGDLLLPGRGLLLCRRQHVVALIVDEYGCARPRVGWPYCRLGEIVRAHRPEVNMFPGVDRESQSASPVAKKGYFLKAVVKSRGCAAANAGSV